MIKLFRFFKFIKERLSHDSYFELDEDTKKLTERMSVRITPNERKLIEKFCEYKAISISRFLRVVASNEVGRFIIQNKLDEKYYNSKVSKNIRVPNLVLLISLN